MSHNNKTEKESLNFLEELIEGELQSGRVSKDQLLTRFPPEPNGYLHLGHASSICLNFGIAKKFGGRTNLRFDDTNPVTEDTEYVESIKADINWLGFQWANEFYASDYFETLYSYAVELIKKGLAYVDDSTAEQIAAMKGTPTQAGTDSPFRNRSVDENLDLFTRMRNGEFKDGEKTLRAKIDMASPNMHLRDPLMYRIKHAHHHRTGDKWCIYPMYDFAHGQSDSIENITHSICTLEFEVHKPLYNWFIEKLGIFPSRQFEFARRNISYTVMSKRKLLQLVNEKIVDGWDDPRMPTISGVRRRGYTAESIRNFADVAGISRRENVTDYNLLESCLREHLNRIAARTMAVINPLKVVLLNYGEDKTETLKAENNPEAAEKTYRDISFSREIYIEKDDFMEHAPEGFFRLTPGGMVRLKHAYIIRCEKVVKNDDGSISEIHCTYIPESKSGQDKSGIKVKSVIHWVDAASAVTAEVRLYDKLFTVEAPDAQEGDFKSYINPDSLKVFSDAKVEPALLKHDKEERFQFLRLGYFVEDKYSTPEHRIYNRAVTLKDEWAKEQKKHR
ncbi:MAG: Glutamine--tRNA ligase [Bacteroidetes bacterium ADurb.Bin141]|nr:glutamine--tRNA ligase/YqeY domain fusion protein [Bacteroidia bacterium]MCE7955965.1 glutamine--tRNA ligase/YqeY domain fusion protein [Bacteroidetes bacterium CHB6]MCO5289748.1 glutamine--tRNA ligase/YqeY domain fusion protein [Bacteroidota bacterium]OQB62727.1 MAG: Glutamine--tRNA ligase [Bacteroidetes bacterium ADurb.Bin141]MCW5931401.1 glutamine--tRNA ligase/YqeY domain fusion protein [Bacteroidota bacterium]